MMMHLAFALLVTSCVILHSGGATRLEKEDRTKAVPVPRDLVSINGKFFFFGLGDSEYVTWNEALVRCTALGMQLAGLEDSAKESMIESWILQNPAYDHWLWTSGTRPTGSSQFLWWSTRAPFTYTHWYPGNPSTPQGVAACVNFKADFGGWEDDSCNDITLNYLCEDKP